MTKNELLESLMEKYKEQIAAFNALPIAEQKKLNDLLDELLEETDPDVQKFLRDNKEALGFKPESSKRATRDNPMGYQTLEEILKKW